MSSIFSSNSEAFASDFLAFEFSDNNYESSFFLKKKNIYLNI